MLLDKQDRIQIPRDLMALSGHLGKRTLRIFLKDRETVILYDENDFPNEECHGYVTIDKKSRFTFKKHFRTYIAHSNYIVSAEGKHLIIKWFD